MISQRKVGIILSYVNLIAKNLVTFVYIPILLRILGQAEYGLFQMTNSVISSLSLFSLGFGSAYVRYYFNAKRSKDEEVVSKLNGLYLILFLIMSILSVIVGMVIIFNVENIFNKAMSSQEINTVRNLMILMIVNIAVTFPSSVFDCNIIAHEEFRFQRSRQLFQTLIVPILTVPLLLIGFKSISIILVQTLVSILFLILNIRFAVVKLKMTFIFHDLDWHIFKEISMFSFFVFLNELTDQVNWNLPNFLLGILLGTKEVALFGVANQIKNIFMSLSTSLSGVFIPKINKIVSTTNDNGELTSIMSRVGRIQFIVLSFFLGGYLLVGKYFIDIWAGTAYQESYVLSILLIIPLIVPLTQSTGIEIQRAKNLHKFRSILYVFFAILNIFITIISIKLIGVIGSGIGLCFSMIVANGFIMNWYYQKKVKLDMKYFWKNILGASPAMIVPVLVLKILTLMLPIDSFLIFSMYGILYVILYLVIFWMFCASRDEKSLFSKYIKR